MSAGHCDVFMSPSGPASGRCVVGAEMALMSAPRQRNRLTSTCVQITLLKISCKNCANLPHACVLITHFSLIRSDSISSLPYKNKENQVLSVPAFLKCLLTFGWLALFNFVWTYARTRAFDQHLVLYVRILLPASYIIKTYTTLTVRVYNLPAVFFLWTVLLLDK